MQKAVHAVLASVGLICEIVAAKAEGAPKGNKYFTASKTFVADFAPEIERMTGRQLHLRSLGGHIGLHSHKDRPSVMYSCGGPMLSRLLMALAKPFIRAMQTATKNTTHWHRNDWKDDVQLIAVDVFKGAK
jgi:hypothetical protein